MSQEPLFITFSEPWFPKKDTVDGLLRRLDMGEKISLSELKEACKREDIKFRVDFK